ncbi:uncharacterized protein G2W53_016922 [Senna tora]|uniref:Uncharacterized protein n=1 Tax=Senna tora TaxID=362788 RepID=A0A834TNY1_9FABA|nr:uncharacterized protein G2W53_016922 [Senna tora]
MRASTNDKMAVSSAFHHAVYKSWSFMTLKMVDDEVKRY